MSRRTIVIACSLVAVLAGGGAWLLERRAHRTLASGAVPTGPASSSDPTWCGKPLGTKAVGQLVDPSACTKISLTGTAPHCFFWADCGDLHFEIDCGEKAGEGRCRCDGEDGPTVPYDPKLCTLDRERPSAGLRSVLDSASAACRWAPTKK